MYSHNLQHACFSEWLLLGFLCFFLAFVVVRCFARNM